MHYYTHGRIGPFVVNEPMVLGHEAAGTIVEVGEGVTNPEAGDRVCMEPGIPDPRSRRRRSACTMSTRRCASGRRRRSTACLTPFVVHPANYTFKLPDNVSFAEGAMVEPFAVGMQAADKAKITPGDTAVVIGAGPDPMVAIAALAGGCSRAIVADLARSPSSTLAAKYQGGHPRSNVREKNLVDEVKRRTHGWGADIVSAFVNARARRGPPGTTSWRCRGRVA